ncbi:hypothetical protein [Symbioplanes lichenis]|uniref:hypothetical protein n=1 Tax=Symbioplanes lichenis TaxID=1629072 RepID=UPI0027387069|nr:hypothetical protein [Actinoplanes lichenis]
MNDSERRKVSLAGLGLISAGAVLGLALNAAAGAAGTSGASGSETKDTAAPPAATAPVDPPLS